MILKNLGLLTVCALMTAPGLMHCSRILAIAPFSAKSHYIVLSSLFQELSNRGHEMVVITPFPSSKQIANYTEISIKEVSQSAHENLTSGLYKMHDNYAIQMPIVLWIMGLQQTEAVIKIPEVRNLLNDKRGFDLVICEVFNNEAIYGFADHFKAPLVIVSPFGGFHSTNYGPANPIPFAYVPNPMLPYTDQMSFTQRLMSIFLTLFWDLGNSFYYYPKQEKLRQELFGQEGKNVWELQSDVSLTLLNNHFSLNYPRPMVPSIIEVGGMHVSRTINKLPSDIQKFLDDAKDGAIYFSMGSNLRSDLMPEESMKAILSAFAELPQRVLWKWESDELPGKTSNVMIGKWLPQQDILAHPNIKVFITHGGLLSAQEAAYHGVPIVGIPVFGDQPLNMKKAELGGYGIKVDLTNITKTSMLWAINKVLHDPKYLLESKRRSAVYRDQPETPMERAVFWTEYVIRHKGAAHLQTSAKKLRWYQLYLLDVAAVILSAVILIFRLFRAVCRVLCSSKKSQEKKIDKSKKRK